MTDLIIHVFKDYINKKDLTGFKEYLLEVQESEYTILWDTIFQKVYIHACLKKNTPVIEFLTEKFEELDPITKIALRQVFAYGKYLRNR
jgi:hypothetical protein